MPVFGRFVPRLSASQVAALHAVESPQKTEYISEIARDPATLGEQQLVVSRSRCRTVSLSLGAQLKEVSWGDWLEKLR